MEPGNSIRKEGAVNSTICLLFKVSDELHSVITTLENRLIIISSPVPAKPESEENRPQPTSVNGKLVNVGETLSLAVRRIRDMTGQLEI